MAPFNFSFNSGSSCFCHYIKGGSGSQGPKFHTVQIEGRSFIQYKLTTRTLKQIRYSRLTWSEKKLISKDKNLSLGPLTLTTSMAPASSIQNYCISTVSSFCYRRGVVFCSQSTVFCFCCGGGGGQAAHSGPIMFCLWGRGGSCQLDCDKRETERVNLIIVCV